MATSIELPSRNTTIALWVLRILIAGLFLFAGVMKLVGHPMMVQEFETVGLGQWFRYLTGLLELAGGVAVLVPSISCLGALVLLVVDVGAFFAQIASLLMDWIHPIVIGAILATLIYLQRAQIRARLGF
jgi:putative oxidoreductase